MKRGRTIYSPSLELVFTQQEIDQLMEASAKHYDGQCRAAGRPGGIIWGIRNFGPGVPRCFTTDQVQLLAKVTEWSGLVLYRELYDALTVLIGEYTLINAGRGENPAPTTK